MSSTALKGQRVGLGYPGVVVARAEYILELEAPTTQVLRHRKERARKQTA